eukprot:3031135-Alexandrium_andersonii.AAC.1
MHTFQLLFVGRQQHEFGAHVLPVIGLGHLPWPVGLVLVELIAVRISAVRCKIVAGVVGVVGARTIVSSFAAVVRIVGIAGGASA